MRITMQSIHNNILTNLNKLTTDMNRINNQISSGKQMSTISDDPVNLVTALGLRSSLTQITTYQDNLKFGDKTITAAENSLTQMKELASRAKVLAIQMANGSITPENRLSAAEEVQHLFESAIALGNTSINGKYTFGGFRTTGYTKAEPAPFVQDARDGYFVNGGRMPDSSTTRLTGAVLSAAAPGAANIVAGNLLINNVDVANITGPIDLTGTADVNGLNMAGAVNAANAINDQEVISQTGVSDTLASPYAGAPATGTSAASRVVFYLNGTLVDTNAVPANNLLAGDSASSVSQKIVNAINAAFPTGTITATKGTGANGGEANALILRSNDGAPMTITGLNSTEKAISGLSNNKATEGVTAKLTTLYAGAVATFPGVTTASFSLNGEVIDVTTGGVSANQTATDVVAAINAIANRTGVTAEVGNVTGTNGGVANSVILHNTLPGDASAITVLGLNAGETTLTGLSNTLATGQAADATHNTGTISLSSTSAFEITTSAANDTILNLLGLGGGLKGFADNAGDGILRSGSSLSTGDLTINGVAITTSADGVSDVYQDISAMAKAAAINNATSQTGVSAVVTPASITAVSAVTSGTETSKLTARPQNNGIAATDLAINGVALGAIAAGAVTDGLNMGMADNAKQAINAASGSTGVTASLTTLYSSGVKADHAALGSSAVSFTINGVAVSINADGVTDGAVATQAVDAINAMTEQTGVMATVGTGTNGGITDSIVLYNALTGDETPIVVAGLNAAETARTGLSNVSQAADATHNTGSVVFSSATAFQLSSPNNLNNDLILDELDLGGGESSTGITGDTAADGALEYGSTPVYLKSGDLTINGIDIFSHATAIITGDSSNALINAINAKTDQTGIKAGKNSIGQIILSAMDGRNLHIQTSALGENVTQLNGGSAPQDQIYFGELRLWGANEFSMNSNTTTVGALTNYETGFTALGLAGGSSVTGQTEDVAGDGKILVNKIEYETGYVRYAGDRKNDFAVKVGQQSSIDVGKNGKSAVMDTGIFTVLKGLQDALRGQNYTTLNGAAKATDTNALMNSGKTGLELENELQNGSFTIAVSSHDTNPPTTLSSMTISIDTAKDSLTDIANRINGVPGISASWSEDGHLQINSNDPERYTFTLSNDTSNFLRATGSETDSIQVSNISKSIADLDTLMNNLTNQVSDFGARANRIIVQQQIYSNLELSTTANLSEKEDTDLTKALMELKGKETAYEAALSAAAKTMQLSLVDFLK